MKWSWKLGSVAGIGLFVHWSFLLLPAYVGFEAFGQGGWSAAAWAIVFVLAVFGCILLHELGHALMARRFGIGTHDITLLPIGGVARLERMPRRPLEELAVALAGPAVNVAIAAVLLAGLLALGLPWTPAMNPFGGAIVRSLLWANVALVVFNMIPAFPMDGGRVLRSLLALVVSHENATLVAATVGQAAAIAFGVFGIWSQQWMLVLVALFVFLAARAELQASRAAAQRSQWGMVRDVMLRQFHTVPAQSPLEDVAQTALFTGQHSFPVVDGNRLVGMLDQQQVLSAMSAGGGNRPVTDVMRREFPLIDENDPIDNTYQRMQSAGHRGLPVFSAGRLVGLLPLERVRQWLVYLAMHAEKLPQRETYDATLPEASRAT